MKEHITIKAVLSDISNDKALLFIYSYLLKNPEKDNLSVGDFLSTFMPEVPKGFREALSQKIAQILSDLEDKDFIALNKKDGFLSIRSLGLDYILNNDSTLYEGPDKFIQINEVDEWIPLSVEPTKEQTIDTLKKIDLLVERVRGDNGFAASEPKAHGVIVATLQRGAAVLRSGGAAASEYVASLAKPLSYLVKRFGDSAIGELAKQAMASVRQWLSF